MAKPKSRRINRSGRKSLKKNRSRKSRSRKIRRNKRVGGNPSFTNPSFENSSAAFYNNVGSRLGIPVMGNCKGFRKSAVKKAVNYYESLKTYNDKINMNIHITSCDEKGKQSQSETIRYDDMERIYHEYNNIIDEENEAVKKSLSYKFLSDKDKKDVVEPHKTFEPALKN